VNPSHAAFRELSQKGYPVSMQAGISAEDCLFADLGIDPATNGCLSIEATNFLIYKRVFDVSVPLVIWQIGMVGDPKHNPQQSIKKIDILVAKLLHQYPPTHKVCVYEAALFSVSRPRRDWYSLSDLPSQEINGISTLFVPALHGPTIDEEQVTSQEIEIMIMR
jgi:uroporphyrin-III C-methyltransferase